MVLLSYLKHVSGTGGLDNLNSTQLWSVPNLHHTYAKIWTQCQFYISAPHVKLVFIDICPNIHDIWFCKENLLIHPISFNPKPFISLYYCVLYVLICVLYVFLKIQIDHEHAVAPHQSPCKHVFARVRGVGPAWANTSAAMHQCIVVPPL